MATEARSKRRLGRGLEALLGPSAAAEPTGDEAIATISLDRITPNRYQPRHVFDPKALEELKKSMGSSGLLQPIVVRAVGDGRFELIAGERRYRAAQQLGWPDIKGIVRTVDDKTMLTLALVENLQRDSLSPIDEALGYERLMADFQLSQAEVGEAVGRDRSTVANALRLLRLPDDVQDLVHTGKLSTGHARALLQIKEPTQMVRAARDAVALGLSVRDVESAGRGGKAPSRRPRRRTSGAEVDAEARRIEEVTRRKLGTDVYLTRRSKNSGRLTVNFYSNDDLARILEIILGQPFDG